VDTTSFVTLSDSLRIVKSRKAITAGSSLWARLARSSYNYFVRQSWVHSAIWKVGSLGKGAESAYD
jgi:hypothetical protein